MSTLKTAACGLALLAAPLAANAEDLVVNGEIEMITETEPAAHLDGAVPTVRSGWTFRASETQQLQMDDFENPAMIDADNGMSAWNTAEGAEGKSCADCHGAMEDSMGMVRATYPKWNEEAGEVRNIQMQVDDCRVNQMGAEPYGLDSRPMLAMEAAISSVGRGQVVDVAIDGPAAETWEMGKELYYTRFGQLDLSCASCHELNYDNYIRADHLSQGQINGFPTYRLKNARLNGTHSRFRGCIRDTRAETFAVGSEEFLALELYVASRGNGLTVEGPAVRN
ncbi:MAG TPA: sulfur oxidation c-type cytochrome SoxA [Salibaculum sp.]|nr:sulfur oxidation c-type cytochrome SoxA [Salibaculum sp.]HKL68651.1 sulfur oxidation c-type cytochrome SoxA [Salibaculum sp.]